MPSSDGFEAICGLFLVFYHSLASYVRVLELLMRASHYDTCVVEGGGLIAVKSILKALFAS